MAMMYSVFLGLIAALFLDVFVLHVNACDVQLTTGYAYSASSLTVKCPNGYVAVDCACSGSCEDLGLTSTKTCRARKIPNTSTTVAVTCLQDVKDNYYTRASSTCSDKTDKILACYLFNTTAGEYGAETRITTNSNYEECELFGDCDSCSIQVLCKKEESSSGGGGSSSGGGGSS